MRIDRRTAVRRLALISVGTPLLPSCMDDRSRAPVVLKNFTIDNDQVRLLEELASTLIPSGATPGAREVSAHLFTLKMLDDCASKEDQQQFLRGLTRFDDAGRKLDGGSFIKAGTAARGSLLTSLEHGQLSDKDLNFLYSTTKKLTILAYSSSQYYLTRVRVYELVPGRFHGCVPVKTNADS
jgi:gluconate 2-dehydrogenase subunit 3-like protein